MKTKATACGKVIVLGEHFVVPHDDGAEAPALAIPLRGVSCSVEVTRGEMTACIAESCAPAAKAAIEEKMARAVAGAADALRIDARGLTVRSHATVPLARGFGSSAAFSVALARALGASDVGGTAHAIETVFHGAPSGLDTSVIVAERPVRFQRGRLVRFVNSSGVDFVAVDSGPRDGAASLIAKIKELRTRERATWARLAARIGDLVDRCESALAAGHADTVGVVVNEAHGILAELGLSTPAVEKVLADGAANGALGGKVSGAGAGGAVLLVAPSGEGERLGRALGARGHSVVAVSPTSDRFTALSSERPS